MCHAGVEEFVYPIKCKSDNIGFISVSGFRSNKDKAFHKIKKLTDEFKIDYNKTIELYNEYLNPEVPEKTTMDVVITPLICMIELVYLNWIISHENDMQTNTDTLYIYVLRHIKLYYNQRITLESLSNTFGYSESYISRVFKRNNGKSINEYICNLRITNAKFLLEMNVLNIQEIASAVGFEDSNYFSSVFKKKCGQSPLKWKKNHIDN
jgi:YesN/AraC family two-component response regulator